VWAPFGIPGAVGVAAWVIWNLRFHPMHRPGRISLRSSGLTILVITNRPLTTPTNGYDLRVWRLCHALAAHEQLVLLTLRASPWHAPNNSEMNSQEVFSNAFESISLGGEKPLFWRHFRLNEDRFFAWGFPSFQRAVGEQINQICNARGIQKIIVFGSNLVGLTRQICKEKHVLLDVCDSVSLTIQREISISDKRSTSLEWLEKRLSLTRWQLLEGKTPQWFDHVVTINQRDTETIQKLSGGRLNLSTIPNGVDPMFENAYREGPCRRKSVAFWGNLSFGPNQDAVRYFYTNVYLPYLKPAAIEWCVIGKEPAPFLVEAAAQDQNIRLLGFVTDLREILADYPIMVNPMRSGSGLKNKVLEANAMGLAVVSTALGMESIDGAVSGETYLLAHTPEEFFNAIVALLDDEKRRVDMIRAARKVLLAKYTWKVVDENWVKLVDHVFAEAIA
jgi:glycosyltransferase involved in cell wall biosynthesis